MTSFGFVLISLLKCYHQGQKTVRTRNKRALLAFHVRLRWWRLGWEQYVRILKNLFQSELFKSSKIHHFLGRKLFPSMISLTLFILIITSTISFTWMTSTTTTITRRLTALRYGFLRGSVLVTACRKIANDFRCETRQ